MPPRRPQKRRYVLLIVAVVVAFWFIFSQFDDDIGDAPTNAPEVQTRRPTSPAPPAPVTTKARPVPAAQPTVPPLRPGDRIPRIIHLSWKTHDLPEAARKVTEEWDRAEPDYVRRVTSDAECLALAAEWPRLLPWYKAQTMKVMRADICRYLIVYKYGGLYRDLDVKHVRPLKEWFNHSAPVVYGYEDEHLCQWFFAAEVRSPCLRDVIEHVTNTLAKNYTFDTAPKGWDLVIDGTGPGAFTVGMQNCTTRPQHTPADMVREKVKHEFAAMNWREGYDSWLVQRQKVLGWADLFGGQRDELIRNFYFAPSATLLAPIDEAAPPLVGVVWQTNHRFGEELLYYPASFAVDGNLDTFSQTENGGDPTWDVRFNSDVRYVRHGTTGAADAVQCVRVWNKRRLHDSEFYRDLRLKVFDKEDMLVFQSGFFGSDDSHWLIKFNLITTSGHIARIQIARKGGALLMSEVEFFSDADCLGPARKLQISSSVTRAPPGDQARDAASEARRFSNAVRRLRISCRSNSALSWNDKFQFTYCHAWTLPQSSKCSVLSVSAGTQQPDDPMLKFFRNLSCTVEAHVETPPAEPIEGVRVVKFSGNIATVARAFADPVTVLHVQLGAHENWGAIPDLITLAEQRGVMHVLIELCLAHDGNPMEVIGRTARLLDRLQQAYWQYGWHVTPHTPHAWVMNVQLLTCTQLSLVNPKLLPTSVQREFGEVTSSPRPQH